MPSSIENISVRNQYLMLTPAGVFKAFANKDASEQSQALQKLLSSTSCMSTTQWTAEYPESWLEEFSEKGWIERLPHVLNAPSLPLDEFLPYVIASLSGNRCAAIGSNEGFCLARTGYTQEQADTLSVAGADFFDFLHRQQQRGWAIEGEAVSFFKQVDLLMPSTSFVCLWIDDSGYVLILEGEPLTNNRAFVELIWAIKTSGLRFKSKSIDEVSVD